MEVGRSAYLEKKKKGERGDVSISVVVSEGEGRRGLKAGEWDEMDRTLTCSLRPPSLSRTLLPLPRRRYLPCPRPLCCRRRRIVCLARGPARHTSV